MNIEIFTVRYPETVMRATVSRHAILNALRNEIPSHKDAYFEGLLVVSIFRADWHRGLHI